MISSKEQILDSMKVGFEFEFFSKMSRDGIAKSIGQNCKKKITVPKEVSGFNKTKIKVHSDFKPTADSWKLEPDLSGGDKMNELVTGPIPYKEARIQLIRILNWIKDNGWTSKKTGIHINISYQNQKLGSKNTILTMNPLKLCLEFDEEFIYKRFPKRRDNVYAKSIKQIYPANKFYTNDNTNSINPGEFLVPNTKYYGINFLKQRKDYLEFRYLGGADYEKMTNKILEILEYICLTLHTVVENTAFNEEDLNKLSNIVRKHKKIVSSFSDFKDFVVNYPNIKLMVDLDGREGTIETFYMSIMRDKIYELIAKCGMRKGLINYDRDIGKLQIRDAILTQCDDLSDIQIINCKVEGIFYNCDFYNCTIEDSHLNDSKLMRTNKVFRCKVNKTTVPMTNEIEESYIDCKDLQISGHLTRCIIRNGEVSYLAKLEDCNIVKQD